MQLHQIEDQDITHSVQVQWILEKLEQHLEHDKEPAAQRLIIIKDQRNAILPIANYEMEYY